MTVGWFKEFKIVRNLIKGKTSLNLWGGEEQDKSGMIARQKRSTFQQQFNPL